MKLQFLLFVICAALLFTIDLPAQQTVVLQPGPEGKDALVNNIFPDITHGNYQNLVATAGTNGGRLDTNRSFIQFDLSAIPQDAEILDAKLSLYFAYDHNGEYSHYGQNQAYLQRITNPWEESEATWHNQPRTTPINQVILPKSESSTQDYEDIDVTLLVQDMFADPEHSFGFMIRMVTEEPYRRMFFASGDYEISDHHPKLVVTYSGCEPPTASYSYVKENRLVNFTDQSSPALSWLWDFGDGYGSYLQNPAHEYSEAGTYITCLTVIDSCSEDTFCDTIDICNLPSAEFSWSANLLNVQFHDSSEYTESYYWYFGDGYFATLQNPVHQYSAPGDYEVCLTAMSSCGNDTICKIVTVDNIIGIDENTLNNYLAVYPNPSSDFINISTPLAGKYQLELFNFSGQQVIGEEINLNANDPFRLNLVRLRAGLYQLRLTNATSFVARKIIIK